MENKWNLFKTFEKMETIIETVEAAIKAEKWSIDYHTDQLAKATDKMLTLECELAELRVKLGTPTKGFEENSFHERKTV